MAETYLDTLRKRFPDVAADFSLLAQDGDFNPGDLPDDTLRRAANIGEIENLVAGFDLVLNAEVIARDCRTPAG